MGSVQSPIITCRMHLSLLSLFLLSGWATSLPSTLIEPQTTKMIHDMMDVIESGMEDPVEGQARAFWIGLTLTSTSTSLETATVTTTSAVRCIEGMFTECGDTTMVPETTPVATTPAAPRKKKHGKHHQKKKNKKNMKNSSRKEDLLDIVDDVYRNAVVTDEDGVEMDVSVLMPELARSAEIDQLMEYYARDDVSSLQSGQLRWSEMEMEDQQRMGDMELEGSHCARNGITIEIVDQMLATAVSKEEAERAIGVSGNDQEDDLLRRSDTMISDRIHKSWVTKIVKQTSFL